MPRRVWMSATAVAVFLTASASLADEPTPEEVLAGHEKRVDAVFRAELGKPLERAKKHPPLGKGRGPYVRGYSYSIVAFAARCLYLNEMLDEANAALLENAQFYLDNPLAISDRDSFHWHAEIVLRLLELYGPRGSKHPGRITVETEALVLEYMWIYTKRCSWLAKAEYEKSKTWHVYSSENHHAMDFTCHWHFSKYAKDLPEYRDKRCDDGATLSEHYNVWNEYFVEYCRERARRGICVEMRSDGYNSTLLKGFYNFYDFGDPQVRRYAGMLLDLYFAYWAEEQIDGHMGGGGSRIKGNNAFTQNRKHGNAQLAWFNFAVGQQPELNGHDIGAMLSDYRPPAVVVDIARDTEGRGTYEVRQRVQGLGEQGHTFPHMDRPDQQPNKFHTDGGGIVRYSYCDPAFILGTPMTEARPLSDWIPISSQSRWQGVIFAGQHDPRIVPIPRASDNQVAFNQFWSVQSKGSLITQKLNTHKGAAEMMVWMSALGLSEPDIDGDIVFVEAPKAYAAIRFGSGEFKVVQRVLKGVKEVGDQFQSPPGYMVVPQDEYTPVVLEVMAKDNAKSYTEFKSMVKTCQLDFAGTKFSYNTIYGDLLTLDTSYKQKPTINGQPVNYAPSKVFDSPFLDADYLSGVVTIRKGQRQKVLDFNGRE